MFETPKTGEVFVATPSKVQFCRISELRDKQIINICGGPKKLYIVYIDPEQLGTRVLSLHCSVFDELNYTQSEFAITPNLNETTMSIAPNPFEQIFEVAAVRHHGNLNVILDAQGDVYTFGVGPYGSLGHGITQFTPAPQKIPKLANKQIIEIACGESHGLALSKMGDVYTWGRGFEGQLGMEHVQCLPFPAFMPFFDRLGYYDSNATEIIKEKKLNVDLRRLTIQMHAKVSDAKENSEVVNGVNKQMRLDSKLVQKSDSELEDSEHLGESKAQLSQTNIANSEKTAKNSTQKSLAAEEKGVRSIKHSKRLSVADPMALENALMSQVKKVPKPLMVKIIAKKIFAAENHSFVISSIDELFGWGENICYQLGITKMSKVFSPQHIEFADKVVHLSTCKTHTTVLTASGTIFATGLNCYHQTGLGKKTAYKTFQCVIRDFDGYSLPKFKLVETNTSYTIAVSQHNSVYYWGKCLLSTAPQTYPKLYSACPTPSQIDFVFANQTNIVLFRQRKMNEPYDPLEDALITELNSHGASDRKTQNKRQSCLMSNTVNGETVAADVNPLAPKLFNFRKSMMTPEQQVEFHDIAQTKIISKALNSKHHSRANH